MTLLIVLLSAMAGAPGAVGPARGKRPDGMLPGGCPSERLHEPFVPSPGRMTTQETP